MLSIESVITEEQLDAARQIMWEYAEIRKFDPALSDFEKEQAQLGHYFGQPLGVILLARWDDNPAGCIVFRPLETSVCEMKRLFVSPAFRNLGIGQAMIKELIQIAKDKGFKVMRLDSHPWMESAQKLYESFGFRPIGRYNDNPTPGIRFFELKWGGEMEGEH